LHTGHHDAKKLMTAGRPWRTDASAIAGPPPSAGSVNCSGALAPAPRTVEAGGSVTGGAVASWWIARVTANATPPTMRIVTTVATRAAKRVPFPPRSRATGGSCVLRI